MNCALFARLEAKVGKEEEVARLLQEGLRLSLEESFTPVWFALRLGPQTFGIFDAFTDEASRVQHLNGRIAAALMEQAPFLLSEAPTIEKVEVLGSKVSC